jgi:hypothetical protein
MIDQQPTPAPLVVGVDIARPGTDDACAAMFRQEADGSLTLLALRPRGAWVDVRQP